VSSGGSSAPSTDGRAAAGSRAPIGGVSANAAAAAKASPSAPKGKVKRGTDQRKHVSSDLDAYTVNPEPVAVPEEPEPAPPEPVVVPTSPVDDVPDSWEEEVEDAAGGAASPTADSAPAVGAGAAGGETSAASVAAPTVPATTTGASLRPGGRMLRPGGASLRPGGGSGAGGHKSGAGSATDFGAASGGVVEIKHRYTLARLGELKPKEGTPFPPGLRHLPDYTPKQPNGFGSSGGGGHGAPGGGDNWSRGHAAPHGHGGKGGGGGGGKGNASAPQGAEQQWSRGVGYAALSGGQLSKTANPFKAGAAKQTQDSVAALEAKLLSILNKLTPQTYEKLKAQIFDLPVDRAPLLKIIIQRIFEKVVDEAAFAELYAKLIADLDKQASNVWSYVKVVVDAGTTGESVGGSWWCADMSSSAPAELLGPCADEVAALDLVAKVASGSQEGTQLVASPRDAKMVKLLKHGDHLVKIWSSSVAAPGQIFVSFDAFKDTVEAAVGEEMAGGPYFDTTKGGDLVKGHDEALKKGTKATSLRRLLLNMCQEAFEQDDIYAAIETKYNEGGDLSKLTAVERANRAEERQLSTIKAKKRMLGNIRFVGELYKLPKMMKEDVIHSCVQKLLGVTNYRDDECLAMDANGRPVLIETQKISKADEENIEALAKLLQTVGAKFEADCAKDQFKSAIMVKYFDRLQVIASDRTLPSRMRFMVQDFFELRKNDYVPRRKEDKQMTQEQIRRIAARDMDGGVAAGGGGGDVGKGGGKGGGKGQEPRGKGGGKGQPLPQQYGAPGLGGNVRVMQRPGPGQSAAQPAAPAPMAARPMSEDVLKSKLGSLLTDWISTKSETEAATTWAELKLGGAGTGLGAAFVTSAVERTADCPKLVDRMAIAELATALVAKGLVTPTDLGASLHEYLEFLEDNLCDIPSLHANLACLLGPLAAQGSVKVPALEKSLAHYHKSGDPPIQGRTIANFFEALENHLLGLGTGPASAAAAQAQAARSRFK